MAVNPEKPYSRKEMYLAKAAGKGTVVPEEPWSREEAYLDDIAGRVDGIEEDVSDLNDKVTAMVTDFSYKGSVDTEDDLPENPTVGDVYTLSDTGNMFVWDGVSWQLLNMSGVDVVQTLGDSETAIMSQKATTGMVYDAPGDKTYIRIGSSVGTDDTRAYGKGVMVGAGAKAGSAGGRYGVSIGANSDATGTSNLANVAIGYNAKATASGALAIGDEAKATSPRAIAIGNGVVASWSDSVAVGQGINIGGTGGVAIGTKRGDLAQTSAGTDSVAIGASARSSSNNGVAVGENTESAYWGVAVGSGAKVYAGSGIALGAATVTNGATFAVAIGSGSKASEKGEVAIGIADSTSTNGYNNSAYRLLTGVYDGQSDHDACTVGQLNTATTTMTDDEFNTLWEEA